MSYILPNQRAPINNSVRNIQTMHADTSSSDTTPLRGPRADVNDIEAVFTNLRATFPTMLRRSDGNIMALATSFDDMLERLEEGTKPIQALVYLFDGDTGAPIGLLKACGK